MINTLIYQFIYVVVFVFCTEWTSLPSQSSWRINWYKYIWICENTVVAKHSFLATPKLFFISQALGSKLFILRSDTYHIDRAQDREFNPGQSHFVMFQLFLALQEQIKWHWVQLAFRLQARVEQMGVVFKITRGCRGKRSWAPIEIQLINRKDAWNCMQYTEPFSKK